MLISGFNDYRLHHFTFYYTFSIKALLVSSSVTVYFPHHDEVKVLILHFAQLATLARQSVLKDALIIKGYV